MSGPLNVVLFTDLEPDDGILIMLLSLLKNIVHITLVVGEGDVRAKMMIAEKMCEDSPFTWEIMPGLPSDKEYPIRPELAKALTGTPMPSDEDVTFDVNKLINVIEASNLVICVKPVRELLVIPDDVSFPDKEFWCTASFNFRCLFKTVSEPSVIPNKLMKLFPKKMVWVESFTAIGSNNQINGMKFRNSPFLRILQQNWNQHIIEDFSTDVLDLTKRLSTELSTSSDDELVQLHARLETEMAKCGTDVTELANCLTKEIKIEQISMPDNERAKATLLRNIKGFFSVTADPDQCLLADQIIVLAMLYGDKTIFKPVKFKGYAKTGYPEFEYYLTEESNLYVIAGGEPFRAFCHDKCKEFFGE